MELISFSFVFVFLPAAILIYYLLPGRFKNLFLLALSLLFYGLLDLQAMLLMVGLLGLQYLAVLGIHRLGREHKGSRLLCACAAIFSVGLLVLWSAMVQIKHVALPLGMLVYLLTGLGYVVDFYRGEAELESPIHFGVMCCFFGKLYAGPLVEYQEFMPGLKEHDFSLTLMGEGVLQFVQGLAKKVLLADQATVIYTAMSAIPQAQLPVLGAWLKVFCAAFTTYFTLSAYCDMAVGLGQIFGLQLPHNFAYPFQSRTVTDFFARFNITVTRYIRRYVYRFLGYDSGGRLSNSFNLMLTAMLAGLWFGIRLSTLAWGMFLGVFMIIEVLWGHKLFDSIPPFFLRIYAFAVVLLSFSLLSANSISQAFNTVLVMIGLTEHAFTNETVQYMLVSRAVVLVACVVFSTSIYHKVDGWFRQKYPSLSKAAAVVLNTMLLVLTLAAML
ncbi:MAG: hypothetical protein IKU72_04970 [Oscillospiraceae bacterium]|nr:hypothetical protein [Oscillospiraceae bacterium]